MPNIQYFPQEVMELQAEIQYHPKLQELMHSYNEQYFDFWMKVAGIAAYCNIALDGNYTEEEMVKICKLCLDRLKYRRGASNVNPENIAGKIIMPH